MGILGPKPKQNTSPAHRGTVSEQQIIARLIAVGYSVLLPVEVSLRYDLVIEDADGKFWRVQCKTARVANGYVSFFTYNGSEHRGLKKRSYRGEVDYFAAYSPDLNKVYFISAEDAPLTNVQLRLEEKERTEYYREKKQGKQLTRWAADYEL